MAEVKLPQLGETVTEGTITKWFKKIGDAVAADEPLFEVSTDKVDTEVPSPVAGILTEMRAKEGDTIPVGAVIAVVGDAGAAPPAWMQFLPLVAMGVIFWLLILRPQMRQQKQQREKIAAIKKGDQVVTGGGLVGKVIKVDETYAELELAPNVKVKAVKTTIADVLSPTGSKPAND